MLKPRHLCHVTLSGDPGLDEVDAAATEDDKQEGPTCTYLVLDSMDQMLINVTPQSLDVITEVLQVSF